MPRFLLYCFFLLSMVIQINSKWYLFHLRSQGISLCYRLYLRIKVQFFCLHLEMKGHWSRVNLVKREALHKIYTRPVSFHFPMQTKKKVFFSPYIYAKVTNNPEKSISIFGSRDRCLSCENICNGFLMLHCRRMTSGFKYMVL